ncbi:hypothetical protein SCHPADRAFT_897605, partial [Schizopora paradoxa]
VYIDGGRASSNDVGTYRKLGSGVATDKVRAHIVEHAGEVERRRARTSKGKGAHSLWWWKEERRRETTASIEAGIRWQEGDAKIRRKTRRKAGMVEVRFRGKCLASEIEREKEVEVKTRGQTTRDSTFKQHHLAAMLPPWLLLGFPLVGLASQVPFLQHPPSDQVSERMAEMKWRPDANFEFKTGDDVFSPKDLVELSRPGG